MWGEYYNFIAPYTAFTGNIDKFGVAEYSVTSKVKCTKFYKLTLVRTDKGNTVESTTTYQTKLRVNVRDLFDGCVVLGINRVIDVYGVYQYTEVYV